MFISGYFIAALIHALGLSLLHRVHFQPASQRLLIIHLAWTELCTSLSQALVYTFLVDGRCYPYSICSFIDKFNYRLFGGTSKLIMIYLICDRAFDIYFHLRYPLYFTQQTVKKVLMTLWVVGVTFALISVLMGKFRIGGEMIQENWRQYEGIFITVFFLGTDSLIVITAVITYMYLYLKVRKILANSQGNAQQDNTRTPQSSKFLLPCLIIATYLIFNLTGTVLHFYSRFVLREASLTKSVLSEIAHMFMVLGWASDGVLYIFLQKSVREKLLSMFRKSVLPISSTRSARNAESTL